MPRDSGDLTPGSWNLPPEVQLRRALTPWGEGETRGGRGGGVTSRTSPCKKHSWPVSRGEGLEGPPRTVPAKARRGPEPSVHHPGRTGGNCPAAQLAQDLRFSGFLWPRSARSAVPSVLASAAVSEARLLAEPESKPLLRGSGAPCRRSPALRLRPAPAALRTRSGLTSKP